MKSSGIQRTLLGLGALCLLGYMGFQGYRFWDSRHETETVYTDVVQESVKVSGLLLRNEIVLEDSLGNDIASYLIADGVKISQGMTIAEVYSSPQDADYIYKIRELENQRQQLIKAQDPGTTNYAHTDVLNKQIFKELGSIIDQVNTDDLSLLPSSSDKLRLLMNTKQITTGRQENFDNAIDLLKAQEEYYAEKIQGSTRQITAERAGYFIRRVDGFEGIVDFKELDELTTERMNEFLLRPEKPDSKRVGKLMIHHAWYYAALVSADSLDPFRVGRLVNLNFGLSGVNPVPATVYQVNKEKGSEQAVVIFQSDYINDVVVNLRQTQAEVAFKSISGLRVSNQALRFEGLEQGVYIVRGDNLIFRPVNVIYEGNGFVLCETANPADPDYALKLQQFDEVVVKGGNLYDGKPIRN